MTQMINRRTRPALAISTAALALALGGCASAPPEHFYSLSNGMGVAQKADTPAAGTSM